VLRHHRRGLGSVAKLAVEQATRTKSFLEKVINSQKYKKSFPEKVINK
jgi:hypothetical protein